MGGAEAEDVVVVRRQRSGHCGHLGPSLLSALLDVDAEGANHFRLHQYGRKAVYVQHKTTSTSKSTSTTKPATESTSTSTSTPTSGSGSGLPQWMSEWVQTHLHELDVARLLEHTPSEEVHVWMRESGGANAQIYKQGEAVVQLNSFSTGDLDAALICHRAGGSLYFRAPDSLHEATLRRLSNELGLSFFQLYPPSSDMPPFATGDEGEDDGSCDAGAACGGEGQCCGTDGDEEEQASDAGSSAAAAEDEEDNSKDSGSDDDDDDTAHRNQQQQRQQHQQPQHPYSDRSEIEVFISQPGHHTGIHFDFMQNFTIQLRGKKRWRLCRGLVDFPIRGCTPHYKDRSNAMQQDKLNTLANDRYRPHPLKEDLEGIEEVTLSAGDVLYFPAGMWHEVTVVGDEPSVSINLSLMTQTWADVFAEGIRTRLLHSTALREAGSVSQADDGSQKIDGKDTTERWEGEGEYGRMIACGQERWLQAQKMIEAMVVQDFIPPVLLQAAATHPPASLMCPPEYIETWRELFSKGSPQLRRSHQTVIVPCDAADEGDGAGDGSEDGDDASAKRVKGGDQNTDTAAEGRNGGENGHISGDSPVLRTYALHTAGASADLSSRVISYITTTTTTTRVVEYIRRQPDTATFTPQQVVDALNSSSGGSGGGSGENDDDTVRTITLLIALVYHGAVVRL